MSDHEEGDEPTQEHEAWTPVGGVGSWAPPNQPPDPPSNQSPPGQPPFGPPAWGAAWQAPTQQVPPTQQYPGGWGSPTPDAGRMIGPGGPMWGPPQVQGAPTAYPPRRRVSAAVTAFLMLLAAAAGVGIGHVAWRRVSGSHTPTAAGGNHGSGLSNPPSNSGSGGLFGGTGSGDGNIPALGSGAPSDVKAIAAKVAPALVDINSTFTYQSAAGAGTGIVISSRGLVLTNNHVIEDATKISVTDIGNHRTYAATVLGYDDTHDMAVLQLTGASHLKVAKLATGKVSVGEPVVAIGNAGGTGGTPTSTGGSVFGVNQSISASDELGGASEQLAGLIAVTADVRPGDSGGSLVNEAGEVIGMDTAASSSFSLQQQNQGGDGYAIPISKVLATARTVEAGHSTGSVHVGATAFLGVITQAVGGENGSVGGSESGAEIAQAIPGEPAQKVGLSAGDVITSFDGHTVTSPESLSKVIDQLRPGDKASIQWIDAEGTTHTATVQLASGPAA